MKIRKNILCMIVALTMMVAAIAPVQAKADDSYYEDYTYPVHIVHDMDICPTCSGKDYYNYNDHSLAGATGTTHLLKAYLIPYGDDEKIDFNGTFTWFVPEDYVTITSISDNGSEAYVTLNQTLTYKDGDPVNYDELIWVEAYDSDNQYIGDGEMSLWIEDNYVPALDISKACTVKMDKSVYQYTGSEITPVFTVTNKAGKILTCGRDYAYKFSDWSTGKSVSTLKDKGTYKLTVYGCDDGPYANEINVKFSIANLKKQTLTGASSYTKPYSTTGFTLNTKTNGNGKLSYKSSNTSVATVSSTGKVTMKGVGKATITVTAAATNTYAKATKKVTVTVKPATNKISSVKNLSGKKMKVTYTKSAKASGYQIQYAANSSFKSAKYVTSSGASKTISKLTKGKTYYVRVRGYKKVSGVTYYGAWSAKKSIKINK